MFGKRKVLLSAGLLYFLIPPPNAHPQQFITAWGSFGAADDQFGYPVEVAVGANGNVYVWDGGASRVKVFTGTGTFVRQWSPPPDVGYGMAVDSYDNVYLGAQDNYGQGFICKFTSTGNILTTISSGLFEYPPVFTVDASGNVYAVNAQQQVEVRAPSGPAQSAPYVFSREWDVSTNSGQAMAVDAAGNFYFACSNRIVKYANDGTYLTQWGSGAGDGRFNAIRVAAGPDGNIYVVDHRDNRVQAFTSEGVFLTAWGSLGSANGQFDQPIGIGVDRHGYIYVADKSNGRIQKFAFEPTPVQAVTWGALKSRYRGEHGAAPPEAQAK